MNEIRSGSCVSVLHELVELFRLSEAGGGAIKEPPCPCPPKPTSGLGLGLRGRISCLLSLSVIDDFLETTKQHSHHQEIPNTTRTHL